MSEHGTISRYTNNRCRCDACRAAWNRYFEGRRERTRILANAYYHAHRAEIRKQQNANAKPRNERSRWFKRAYGMSEAEVAAIFEAQGRKCAICETTESRIWHLDHDHESGAVRAVLCLNCNCGIGHLHDSPDLLRKAAAYLEAAADSI